jgi:UDPglucose 6-dehydrogenase
MDAAKEVLGPVTYGKDPYEIADGADAVVLVTEWDEFRALDFNRLKTLVRKPVLVDLRNIYPIAEVVRHGFSYFAVGKKSGK